MNKKLSLLVLSLIFLPTLNLAQEVNIKGDEIRERLTDKKVVHRDGATAEFYQTFEKSGVTHYQAKGRALEIGKWSIQGDQYCSQWGPFGWTCYDVTAEGNTITWLAKDGTKFEGRIISQ